MAEVSLALGGAFLSATLQVLFDRLASRPVLDFVRGRNALLKKLKRKLMAVNIVLNDAEEKQITDPMVKAWLDELKDAVYVADDLLDEIATEALRSKLDAESDGSSDQVPNNISTSLNSFDEGMQSRIEEILERLESIAQDKDVLGLKQVVGGKLSQRLPSTSLVDDSMVYGRDHDKEKILEFLLSDDESSGNEICVLTIVGMGGLGKTTLAQLVYNDTKVKEFFDFKAWVCVSEEFDVLRVTKTILEAINPSASDSMDLNLLQVKLKESLSKKKFLLILDDVWNEKYNDWDTLRTPFRCGVTRSKIIVTTRSENVASIMGSVPTHHLNQLSDEQCWSLFAKHAFDKNNFSKLQELEVIGKNIVKKCKGLPLAAKTLGGVLRSKADVANWYNILNSELWELPNDKSSILPALRLSYHYLPSHLKCCFAYCSIFPKDYEFTKLQVVLLWMAEGFLRHRIKQMEDIGDEYFTDIVSKSLFQQSSQDKSCFVMHDLVNDLAKYVSGEFSFSLEDKNLCEISEKTRHLSFSTNRFDASRKFKAITIAKDLHTFLPLGQVSYERYYLADEVPQDILPALRFLRVLSFSHYDSVKELPDSLGGLNHLRYLDFSYTAIRKLPDSTSNLCNLQTLLLHNCDQLTELPKNMGKLISLRHLDVEGTKLKEMPMHVSRLKNLQTLSTFIVGKHNGSTIKELRELNDLHGGLDILNLENTVNARDAQEGNLKDKVHIEELLLKWSINTEDSQKAREVLDKFQPQAKLIKLTIERYGGTSFPDWLGDQSYSNMVFLRLSKCKYCLTLPPVGRLPSLRELFITRFNEVVTVGPEFYGKDSSVMKPFGLLEKLTFQKMPKLEEWFCSVDEGVEFVCLKELCIDNCPKLKGLLPSHLPCLTTLKLVNCDQLVMLGGNDDANFQSTVDVPGMPPIPIQLQHYSWPCLKKLEISNLPELKELPPGLMQNVSAIEDLCIRSCISFESLPMTDLPTTLKQLYLSECPKLDMLLPETDNQIQTGHRYCDASISSIFICSSCDTLKSFPLGLFPKLTNLSFIGGKNLESFWIPEGVHGDNLTSLLELFIYSCPKLESFPNGGLAAPNLTSLSVWLCASLKSLPEGMHNLLPSLEHLAINKCPELESFPEGGLPSNLISLQLNKCDKLTARRMEWGLQRLPNLESFLITGEEDVVDSFPEEWLLPSSLAFLRIFSFPNMKYLNQKGLQHLTSLQELEIWNCPKLQCLLEEGPLPNSISLLKIWESPLFEKWCQREKGEGWPNIAHIPYIKINGECISCAQVCSTSHATVHSHTQRPRLEDTQEEAPLAYFYSPT